MYLFALICTITNVLDRQKTGGAEIPRLGDCPTEANNLGT